MRYILEFFGKLKAIRLDNCPKLTAESLTEWARQYGIEL